MGAGWITRTWCSPVASVGLGVAQGQFVQYRSACVTAIAAIGLVHAALARAVQPDDGLSDRDELCAAYEDADVVVLGRAHPPIVVRISGEKAIADFLASTASGATIFGHLTTGPTSGADPSLGGTRVEVTSGSWRGEALTEDDGRFTISGIPPGRISLRPRLPPELGVVERSSLSLELGEGNCQVVRLTVRLNGRVRGRIFNAAGIPPDAVTLVLDAGIAYGGPGHEVRTTHQPFSETGLNPDGTFEFTGEAPGSYVLIARYPRASRTKPHQNVVTYFPGTRDLGEALRIDVGRATEHDGLDFAIATEAAITPRP